MPSGGGIHTINFRAFLIPTLRALFGPSEDTLPTVKVQLADLKSYNRLASTPASDLEVTA